MEVAASLVTTAASVTVIGKDPVPFFASLGEQVTLIYFLKLMTFSPFHNNFHSAHQHGKIYKNSHHWSYLTTNISNMKFTPKPQGLRDVS